MCKVFPIFLVCLALLPVKAPAFCFEEAGRKYGIAPEILRSIAEVESGLNPEKVNYNLNGSYDYGLMQINSRWYHIIGEETWKMLGDPCMNIMVSAWVLSDCMRRHGYTWEAVGCYNAESKEKGAIYALKVGKALEKTERRNKKRLVR